MALRFRSILIALVGVILPLQALAEAQVRVALLPIAVHAAGDETEYLSTGLAEMLAARLEQYEGVVVLRPEAGEAAPDSLSAAREDAAGSGAAFVLYGSFTQFGEGASLDLRCARVEEPAEDSDDPGARRIFVQSGTVAEIIPKLDTLARKIARYAVDEAGGTVRLAGEEPAAANGVAAQSGATAVTPSQFEELMQRVEALERSIYTPVAQGEAPAPDALDVDPDASPSLVR